MDIMSGYALTNYLHQFQQRNPIATRPDCQTHARRRWLNRSSMGRDGFWSSRYASSMSTADEWDFTVPDDDDELLAELRRHGVRPGRRLHLALSDQASSPKKKRTTPEFFGSFSGAPDLAERTDEILHAEFPNGR